MGSPIFTPRIIKEIRLRKTNPLKKTGAADRN